MATRISSWRDAALREAATHRAAMNADGTHQAACLLYDAPAGAAGGDSIRQKEPL